PSASNSNSNSNSEARQLPGSSSSSGSSSMVPSPHDPAFIFFTSGSTGPAKGVTHTRATFGWVVACAMQALQFQSEDVLLPGSSMSHIGALMHLLAALAAGARVVVARTFDAGEILPLLCDQRPTILHMLPAALFALV